MMSHDNLLILVDGSSYLYRAFHALPPLSNAQGLPTGAVYGLTSMLKNLLTEYQPVYAAVVFDAPGPTFRQAMYSLYKAHRPAMPEELVAQIPLAHQVVQALGFSLLIESGVEADDVIGTLAKQAKALGMSTLIFTGDKDFAQLVNASITLVDTMKNTRLDEAGVQEKFGIPPALIVDYLSLIGDEVDNVPGVRKVGPKTAVKWLTHYGSLAKLMDHAQDLSGQVGENFRAALPQLTLARQLVTIRCDVPLPCTPSQLRLRPIDSPQLQALFRQLEFKKWLTSENLPLFEKEAVRYRTIASESALAVWVDGLKLTDLMVLYPVTTRSHYLVDQLVGLALFAAGEAVYIALPGTKILAILQPVLENPTLLKVGPDLKYQAHVFANHGIVLQGLAYDTMLESYVLDSTTRHDMSSLTSKYLQVPLEEVVSAQTASQAADLTWQLHRACWSKLQTLPKLSQVFTDLEMPLLPVLMRMERHGIKIDAALLQAHSLELAEKLRHLEQQAYTEAGQAFNLNSPKQVQQILFDKLQLPILKKTPTKQASTAEEVLEELALDYPLPQLILEYRRLSKLKSTYTDVLPQQINLRTGRVHTSYHQAVTVTGRLSSSDPNLQNIPIRTAEGRRIRQAFVAPEGYCLLAADYSQIELRIMAHLSGDEKLLAAFASGGDVHQTTAAEIFGVPLAAVTFEQRRRAKVVNFGLMYGMQAFGLAKQLGVEQREAQEYLEAYFERYAGVKRYMETTRELARQQGYVETVGGRRLYLPEIHARHSQVRQYAERTAINAPLQGTAADVIKLAMVKIDQWIQASGLDLQMLLQVHDELVFQVALEVVEEARGEIGKLMEAAASSRVPLRVEVGVGSNWEEAH